MKHVRISDDDPQRQSPPAAAAAQISPTGEISDVEEDYGYGEYQVAIAPSGEYQVAIAPLDEAEQAYYGHRRTNSAELREAQAADRLSTRILAVPDEDEDPADKILRESLRFLSPDDYMEVEDELEESEQQDELFPAAQQRRSSRAYKQMFDGVSEDVEEQETRARQRLCTMIALAVLAAAVVAAAVTISVEFIGPPNQPLGPYELIERQEGEAFFDYYNFYDGHDSVGSNGYLMYVNHLKATELGIVNITMEKDVLDVFDQKRTSARRTRSLATDNLDNTTGQSGNASDSSRSGGKDSKNASTAAEETASTPPPVTTEDKAAVAAEKELIKHAKTKDEPFVYISSSPTKAGPRDSVRLEGIRRFNRGLFIIDLRHVPAGCGVWPAFWLTDEANWPVNGEIDIVEGVNYQSVAKTALHSTKGCSMDDIPLGTMTGGWDTSIGIPDSKTGIPDMTLRYAKNCFVYDPHQWLNQGCVAMDKSGGTLGIPLNMKGGGVFALEWDPINRHMRSYVFSPHANVPENLVQAIRTASLPPEERVLPDPNLWPTPYGFYAIGEGTNCPASHFRNMRIVLNTAFCGSVSGNRYHMDCPKQAKQFDTCNKYVASQPDEIKNEAYWKIRGIYVYQREWERTWLT